jgi:uncharacterized protein (TIGR02145 family)
LEKEIATNPGKYSLESDTLNPAWKSEYEDQTDWRPAGNLANGWGSRMKSQTRVNNTNSNGVSKTDGTGFNVLLVGRFDSGKVANFGTYTYIWSSSADNGTSAWRRVLSNDYSGAYRATNGKYFMFSVRCKK